MESNIENEYKLINSYQNFEQDELVIIVNGIKGSAACIFASWVYYLCFFIGHF